MSADKRQKMLSAFIRGSTLFILSSVVPSWFNSSPHSPLALLASLAVQIFAGVLSGLLGFREPLQQPKLAGLGSFFD
jgi:hypothetical protein